jgi:hypothetical protein
MGMRILRGLSSRFLPCGCLAGVYETYDGEIVGILDARSSSCADSAHVLGNAVPIQPPAQIAAGSPPAAARLANASAEAPERDQ